MGVFIDIVNYVFMAFVVMSAVLFYGYTILATLTIIFDIYVYGIMAVKRDILHRYISTYLLLFSASIILIIFALEEILKIKENQIPTIYKILKKVDELYESFRSIVIKNGEDIKHIKMQHYVPFGKFEFDHNKDILYVDIPFKLLGMCLPSYYSFEERNYDILDESSRLIYRITVNKFNLIQCIIIDKLHEKIIASCKMIINHSISEEKDVVMYGSNYGYLRFSYEELGKLLKYCRLNNIF